jgi:hypothetical protein
VIPTAGRPIVCGFQAVANYNVIPQSPVRLPSTAAPVYVGRPNLLVFISLKLIYSPHMFCLRHTKKLSAPSVWSRTVCPIGHYRLPMGAKQKLLLAKDGQEGPRIAIPSYLAISRCRRYSTTVCPQLPLPSFRSMLMWIHQEHQVLVLLPVRHLP